MRGPACTSLALGLCLLIAGCATIGPPQPPSLELPKPPTDLRATRRGDKVLLTWTIPTLTTDRQSVRSPGPTRICRGLDPVLSSCATPVGEAAPPQNLADMRKSAGQKAAASYSDTLPGELERDHPLGFITYAVEALNTAGRGAGPSNQVHVPLVPTLPSPQDFNARVTGEGVALTWTGYLLSLTDLQPVRYLYRVYRRQEGSQQPVLVGQLPLGIDPHPSLTDQSFEWEKTYYYHATTVTVIAQPGKPEIQVEGDDTPDLKVFADDVFPPAVPSGLQAVFSGPGQEAFIDLIWAPVTDVDLAGYNVYRHEAGKAPEKVNSELMKTPAYRDQNVVSGKDYFYSVSAVDARGNESAQSEEMSERVPLRE
jgi:hypothetical protein